MESLVEASGYLVVFVLGTAVGWALCLGTLWAGKELAVKEPDSGKSLTTVAETPKLKPKYWTEGEKARLESMSRGEGKPAHEVIQAPRVG